MQDFLRLLTYMYLAIALIACSPNEESEHQSELERTLFLNRVICEYFTESGLLPSNLVELNKYIILNYDSNESFSFNNDYNLILLNSQDFLVKKIQDTLLYNSISNCVTTEDGGKCNTRLFTTKGSLPTDSVDIFLDLFMESIDPNHILVDDEFMIRSESQIYFELKVGRFEIMTINDTITNKEIIEKSLNESEVLKSNDVRRGIVCYWYYVPPNL